MAMAMVTVVAVGAGCGGENEPVRSPSQPQSSPASVLSGQMARRPRVIAPTPTTVALPKPIRIPDDPYAPEPVVQVGTIEIPKIGLTAPLFEGVTLNNIDRGPSHWTGTALPGQRGNLVVAGHRASHGQPFLRIDELVAGDEVTFDINGTRATYRVRLDMVVAPEDTWIADQTPARTATLYACHPVGSAEKRYVVRLALAA
jgi:sortase A